MMHEQSGRFSAQRLGCSDAGAAREGFLWHVANAHATDAPDLAHLWADSLVRLQGSNSENGPLPPDVDKSLCKHCNKLCYSVSLESDGTVDGILPSTRLVRRSLSSQAVTSWRNKKRRGDLLATKTTTLGQAPASELVTTCNFCGKTSHSTSLTRSDRRKRKDAAKAQQPSFTITTTPDRRSATGGYTPHKHKHDQGTPVFMQASSSVKQNKAVVLLGEGGPTVRVARRMGASVASSIKVASAIESTTFSNGSIDGQTTLDDNQDVTSVGHKRKAPSPQTDKEKSSTSYEVTPKAIKRDGKRSTSKDATVAALVAGGTPLLEALESLKKKKKKKKKNAMAIDEKKTPVKGASSSGLGAFLSGL